MWMSDVMALSVWVLSVSQDNRGKLTKGEKEQGVYFRDWENKTANTIHNVKII